MPASGINKFLYDFWCPNRALDNSTINSYPGYLHLKILLQSLIPTSSVCQPHYGNLYKIAAFSNSTKKYDAYNWH